MQLQFTVPGRPVPAVRTTQRQKFVDPRYAKYRDYKDYFAMLAQHELNKHRLASFSKDEPIVFNAKVYLYSKRRVDVDNLLKSFFDASNRILWHDDSQVVKASVEKIFVSKKDEERVEISMSLLNYH